MSEGVLFFDRFRLDEGNECVWNGSEQVVLRPKSFTLLRYMVERAGRLTTKDELLEAVWPGIAVGEAVLTGCVREIRDSLGDDRQTPRFIQTVHRRGYRFVAPVSTSELPSVSAPSTAPARAEPALVGRHHELTRLRERLDRAIAGERQVVFVTGEAGIGKTALVAAGLAPAVRSHGLRLAQGQCVDHFGAAEPYLPVLVALGRLCRGPEGPRMVSLLAQHAPAWLAQMPALLGAVEMAALQPRIQGATRERMLREMAEAIDAVTAERPLALWLEDLHWSDPSTLDLIDLLARRREPARFLLVATYRPVDVIVSGHPLKSVKQELVQHGHASEMPLEVLAADAVAEYLAGRFPGAAAAGAAWRQTVQTVHRRTEGHPLFMIHVADHLVECGAIRRTERDWEVTDGTALDVEVPASVRQMIEHDLDRLGETDQRVLEAASVAGLEFSVVAVASALDADAVEVEERCEGLARRGQFLRPRVAERWPDGTIGAGYGFVHALHQDVLYRRVTAARRARLHRRIGERMEAGYGGRTVEIAAVLALHFEHGQDAERGIRYLTQAAQHALRVSANREALELLGRGLGLLDDVADAKAREALELGMRLLQGMALISTRGYGASEVAEVYGRARDLCDAAADTAQLFSVLCGLIGFSLIRGDLVQAHDLALRALRIAESAPAPELTIEAHRLVGSSLFFRGDFVGAQEHLDTAIRLADATPERAPIGPSGLDPAVAARSFASWNLQTLGYLDQALTRSRESLERARSLSHANTLGQALNFAIAFHGQRREWAAAGERAEEARELAVQRGLPFYAALSTFYRGWLMGEQGRLAEGIVEMQAGIAAYRATGAAVGLSASLSALADAQRRIAHLDEASATLDEAFAAAEKSGQQTYLADLHRNRGELFLARARRVRGPANAREHASAAEGCFLTALGVARDQKARWRELDAAMCLARLWQGQGHADEAGRLLAETVGGFTEGFTTENLSAARALLAEIERATRDRARSRSRRR